MKTVTALFATLIVALLAAPCGNGAQYTNPVADLDLSDPDAIRVGNDYWLTASSFANTPGLPIYHSTDLVNWELVNHALPGVPPAEYFDAAPRHGKGVWAPSIRFHDDTYYILWGDPDFGIFMIETRDPAGEWSQPVLVKSGKGMIDPVPLWDEDGRAYIAHGWAGSRCGFNSVITVMEMSTDMRTPIGNEVMVFDGNDGINHTIEGPKLYKRDGYYWIFAPAGGVQQGWQLAMRSKNIYGPYEARIVMAQKKSPVNGPHQGALVDTPDGEEWFLHFQDKGVYGRVLHLNPVKWVDGWPLIGRDTGENDGIGEPYISHQMPIKGTRQHAVTQVCDDFSAPALAPQWHWAANPQEWYGFPTNAGYFRLNAAQTDSTQPNLWFVPNLLLQKFPGTSFTVTAELEVNHKENTDGLTAGLLLFGYDYGYIGVRNEGDTLRLVQGRCTDSDQGTPEKVDVLAEDLPITRYDAGLNANISSTILLRATVSNGGEARFAYSLDGKKYINAGTPFQCRQGKWVGAKTGVFAVIPRGNDRGWVNIRRFDIENIKHDIK